MLISLRLETLWYVVQQIQSSLAHIPTSSIGPLSLWQTTHPSLISVPLLAHGARLRRPRGIRNAIVPSDPMTRPIRLMTLAPKIVKLTSSIESFFELFAKENESVKNQRLVLRLDIDVNAVI
jgi:hypothetical protein